MVEDENPLKTAAQDTGAGLLFGSAGGAVGGNIEKSVRGKIIENNTRLKGIDKKLNNKKINKYYQDYEQGVDTTLVNGINVKLPSDGMKETIIQNPAYANKVVNLSKNLRNAEISSTELPIHNHKYPIKQFHRLKGDNVDYYIAENKKGNNYFYKITTPDLTGPKPEDQGLLKSVGYINNNQNDSNNIIPQTSQTLNPNLENISKKPSSFDEWLEELKRKRKFRGR